MLLLLSSCILDYPATPLDCAAVALTDAAGDPDACDVSACENCVDDCGVDCRVLESYPPVYACDDASWDVYGSCPDWQPASSPSATEISDDGCGGAASEVLTASATAPGRIDVTHTDYMGGCCPQSVEVAVTAGTDTLSVEYTLVDDLCECYCMLDVSYAIVDVPSGHWALVAGPSGATADVDVP